MRVIKISVFTLVGIFIILFGIGKASFAFHSGGVAECEGCHTMHNSYEGKAVRTGGAGPYLLNGTDSSSTCLNCHMGDQGGNTKSYFIATPPASMPDGTPPNNYTPAGDFGWLKKTYTWIPRSGAPTETSKGERKGHNIVAADYLYVADSTLTTSPGGSYPAAGFSCISCHDPHGRYRLVGTATNPTQATTGKPIKDSGSYGAAPDANLAVGVYRLLGGVGYQPKSLSGSYAFSYGAIYAVSPEDYNRSEAASDVRVAYGRNSHDWCANCHLEIHASYGSGYVHPVGGYTSGTIISTYNQYRKSGDLTGTVATAYLSLVPFQIDNLVNLTTLKSATTSRAGMVGGDRVTCLSCHRAHASGWDSMMRWSMGNEFMTVADSAGTPVWADPVANPAQAQGRTTAETQAAYYGRPATAFAPYQRVLCNKCHAKD